MNIIVFLNGLGLGGTEKAAARWAWGLRERGHQLCLLTLEDGPRRAEFEAHDIEVRVVPAEAAAIRDHLRSLRPEVIHAHAPGHPHRGDVLGEALASLPKIPLLQTNIFGQLENPKENRWTDFRLFISWTSCVQAARRTFQRLDTDFFRSNSVAVYPLDPEEAPPQREIEAFRTRHGVQRDEILFGRLSRPEPNKWTDLPIQSFRMAARHNNHIKLLLREPPLAIQRALESGPDCHRFVILPVTSNAHELKVTIASLDAVLHTSVVGESFGYGIAEPMNLGKPIITNSTPWLDQAQLELVRHGECGFIASTPEAVAERISSIANDAELRTTFGQAARKRIRKLAEPRKSIDRLEAALDIVTSGIANPNACTDLASAKIAAHNLDAQQFGHTVAEQIALRPFYYRVRFHQLRQVLKTRALARLI